MAKKTLDTETGILLISDRNSVRPTCSTTEFMMINMLDNQGFQSVL